MLFSLRFPYDERAGIDPTPARDFAADM